MPCGADASPRRIAWWGGGHHDPSVLRYPCPPPPCPARRSSITFTVKDSKGQAVTKACLGGNYTVQVTAGSGGGGGAHLAGPRQDGPLGRLGGCVTYVCAAVPALACHHSGFRHASQTMELTVAALRSLRPPLSSPSSSSLAHLPTPRHAPLHIPTHARPRSPSPAPVPPWSAAASESSPPPAPRPAGKPYIHTCRVRAAGAPATC